MQFNRTNDVTVTGFVESWGNFDGTDLYGWAKGGIMIRDTLDANSAHASVFSTGYNYVAMQSRPSTSAGSVGISKNPGTRRLFLRLVKEGSKITSYYKNEFDLVYQKLGSYEVTFTREWYYVGIAACSHVTGTLASLELSHFDISDEIYTLPAIDVGDTGREIVAQKLNADVWSIQGAGYDIGVSSVLIKLRTSTFSIS